LRNALAARRDIHVTATSRVRIDSHRLPAAHLRDDSDSDPGRIDMATVDEAEAHGLAALLYFVLRRRGALDAVSPAVRSRLHDLARQSALVDELRARDLREVVATLGASGIRPLIFKGAALAATHYAEPWLRTRGDTDVLVRRAEADRVGALLQHRGLKRLPRPRGRLVTQQARYDGVRGGIPIAYDVHWRVADPHVFADALPYAELARDAVADHPSGARRLSNVHALAVACLHRAAHHYDAPHLGLLYDVHLLADGLTSSEWQSFGDWAERARMRVVSLRALSLATDVFGCVVPADVRVRLESAGLGSEPSAVFVAPGRNGRPLRRFDVLLSDLRALGSMRDGAALVRQHLFPGREYVAPAADDRSAAPRYVARIARGVAAWFEPL